MTGQSRPFTLHHRTLLLRVQVCLSVRRPVLFHTARRMRGISTPPIIGQSKTHQTLVDTAQSLALRQQVLHSFDLISSSLLLVRPLASGQLLRTSPPSPQPSGRDLPRPNPHRGLDALRPNLMHHRVRLADHPHDLVPAALDRRTGRVHRVRQPRRLEQFLHLGDLLGHRQLARADLYGERVRSDL